MNTERIARIALAEATCLRAWRRLHPIIEADGSTTESVGAAPAFPHEGQRLAVHAHSSRNGFFTPEFGVSEPRMGPAVLSGAQPRRLPNKTAGEHTSTGRLCVSRHSTQRLNDTTSSIEVQGDDRNTLVGTQGRAESKASEKPRG